MLRILLSSAHSLARLGDMVAWLAIAVHMQQQGVAQVAGLTDEQGRWNRLDSARKPMMVHEGKVMEAGWSMGRCGSCESVN